MFRNTAGKITFPLILTVALSIGLLVGCSDDNAPLTPDPDPVMSAPYDNAGTFQLTLIDGPVDFDDFILVIKGLSAHRASEDSLDGWYGIEIEPAEYHLLDLTNGVSALIADAELPAGTYNQLRLLLDEGNRVVVDGEEFDLFIPSGLKSGIKIHHEFDIVEGEDYAATLDIDAERSVKVNGRGRYRLSPRLRVQENDSAGCIIGLVSPVEAEAKVWTVAGTDTVSTFADVETGAFQLSALPAGEYTLNFTPTGDGPYIDAALVGVEVLAGQTTDIGTFMMIAPD
jgi:Domain of unknown function (DUF4382)